VRWEPGSVKKLMLPVACYGKYEDAYSYWGDRLDASGVDFEGNFDDPMIWFRDPDGLSLTIAISYGDNDPEGPIEFKPGNSVPSKYQLIGINGIRLESPDRTAIAFFMRHAFGCALHDQREVTWAKRIFNHCGGALLKWENPSESSVGEAGSVHHVAMQCPANELAGLHARLSNAGIPVGEIADHSEIGARCFSLREPGGALMEVAAALP
jgi:hypothetical protein